MGLHNELPSKFRPKPSVLVLAGVLGVTMGLSWLQGARVSAKTRVIGQDRVVSWESVPASMLNDELCEVPAAPSASQTIRAASARLTAAVEPQRDGTRGAAPRLNDPNAAARAAV